MNQYGMFTKLSFTPFEKTLHNPMGRGGSDEGNLPKQ
jgi:hypothetical protein